LGLISLPAFLKRHRRIALDISIFIYHLEANPSYADMAGEDDADFARVPQIEVGVLEQLR
jgi:hypothetical protein